MKAIYENRKANQAENMSLKMTQVQVNIRKNVLLVPYHQPQKDIVLFPVGLLWNGRSLAKESKKRSLRKSQLKNQAATIKSKFLELCRSGQNEENIK